MSNHYFYEDGLEQMTHRRTSMEVKEEIKKKEKIELEGRAAIYAGIVGAGLVPICVSFVHKRGCKMQAVLGAMLGAALMAITGILNVYTFKVVTRSTFDKYANATDGQVVRLFKRGAEILAQQNKTILS